MTSGGVPLKWPIAYQPKPEACSLMPETYILREAAEPTSVA
jgi:hypothetical protein